MNNERKTIALWTACALWMLFIFSMSAMPGDVSGAQSGRLSRLLAACLSPFFELNASALIMLETIVRKGAHMAEYAVLFLLYRACFRHHSVRLPGAWAMMMTLFYAATDEFHQYFVPGRGPAVLDVAIDGCGALIAWGLCRLPACIRPKPDVR